MRAECTLPFVGGTSRACPQHEASAQPLCSVMLQITPSHHAEDCITCLKTNGCKAVWEQAGQNLVLPVQANEQSGVQACLGHSHSLCAANDQ